MEHLTPSDGGLRTLSKQFRAIKLLYRMNVYYSNAETEGFSGTPHYRCQNWEWQKLGLGAIYYVSC